MPVLHKFLLNVASIFSELYISNTRYVVGKCTIDAVGFCFLESVVVSFQVKIFGDGNL